jgi:hypothetical protein
MPYFTAISRDSHAGKKWQRFKGQLCFDHRVGAGRRRGNCAGTSVRHGMPRRVT